MKLLTARWWINLDWPDFYRDHLQILIMHLSGHFVHKNRASRPVLHYGGAIPGGNNATKMIQFSGDVSLPAIGQGTWYMGEDASQRKTEVAALRAGIELGLTLIDTAEMYADGGAEKVVGEALTGLREKVFLVSKVYPWNAGGQKR